MYHNADVLRQNVILNVSFEIIAANVVCRIVNVVESELLDKALKLFLV